MSCKSISKLVMLILLSLIPGVLGTVRAQADYDPAIQTPELLYDEAHTVYLGNLARRDNGIPPLRWNQQLTYAARWFSWDSTENRPGGYCGHEDTLGGAFWNRAATWGYLGWAGAENAYCGYVSPQDAINGWMISSGHRANLLNPAFREVGLGYYRRLSDGQGYIAQVFGGDYVYAPAIIENEAVSTTNSSVNLYIHDRDTTGGFISHAPATQMMVSNNPHFQGAAWEPYSSNKAWTLTGGTGWRNVYVKTRDRFNRTMTVSDTIYLGASVPMNELGAAQMSTTQSQVTIYNLNGGALPQAQFSLGWLADDTHESFEKFWGNGERVNDATAWGGTAYRLYPGNGESFAWVNDWKFPIKNVPLVAYFRLKVNNNSSSSEVARLSVQGGATEYGPLILRGSDFTAPNQYQEFALNFTFSPATNDPFLTFKFWGSGSADVYVDAVSIFSMPQPVTSTLTWLVPGNNYRGQGVWVRYTNGTQFSALSEAVTVPPPSHTISGNAGVGGVTLSYADGIARTVTSSGNGSYALPVSDNWSGTVTPTHPCFNFTPPSRSYGTIITDQTSQNYTAALEPAAGCANIDVSIAGNEVGHYGLPPGSSVRASYPGVDDGPAAVVSTNGLDIIASLRVIWREPGQRTSYSEMMGLPDEQLSTEYWFPWYNNLDRASMEQGFRIANVDSTAHTIRVFLGSTQMGNDIILNGGVSTRVGFDVNSGPIRIACIDCTNPDDKILAALRVIWKEPGSRYSYAEMMGLPGEQLSTEYWYPWYNNLDAASMNQGFRIASVNASGDNTVEIWVAGELQQSFNLAEGASVRVGFEVNNGPIQVVCTTCTGNEKIVTSLRVIWKEPGFRASYSEMMGLPLEQLSTEYWYPWYNNLDTNSMAQGFRIATVHASGDNDIEVWVGGELQETFTLAEGASARMSYEANNGPARVVCRTCTGSERIVTSLRIIWKEPGFRTSYSEMMGLPTPSLSTNYWFPWYNNLFASTIMDQGFRISRP